MNKKKEEGQMCSLLELEHHPLLCIDLLVLGTSDVAGTHTTGFPGSPGVEFALELQHWLFGGSSFADSGPWDIVSKIT